jgi:hypothetical protein
MNLGAGGPQRNENQGRKSEPKPAREHARGRDPEECGSPKHICNNWPCAGAYTGKPIGCGYQSSEGDSEAGKAQQKITGRRTFLHQEWRFLVAPQHPAGRYVRPRIEAVNLNKIY